MKNLLRLTQIFVISLLAAAGLSAQILLQEDFDYTAGDKLTTHGWVLNSATSGPFLTVNNGGLTYAGYQGSGIGNAAKLVGVGGATNVNGEDLYKTFSAEQTSGTIYVTFMLNVTGQPSAPDFFFHLCPTAPGGKYQGRMYIQTSGAGYQLGITKLGPSVQWASTVLELNRTYLILLKYTIVGLATDAGTDDYCQIFINPALGGAEPLTADAQSIDAGADAKIGSVMMRQGGVLYDNIQIDGIRASLSWTDLALPVELNSFTARATQKGALLNWSTATEVNNRGFNVERKAVVSGGSDAWQTVGFVQGAGTSNTAHSYSYSDPVSAGKYSYRLKQVDNDGAFKYYGEIEVQVGAANGFHLYGNYPNPFNPSTAIRFSVAQDGRSQVKIFNVLGQEVATIFNEMTVAGTMYEARFDASALPSGLYFARLISNNSTAVVKMLLAK